MFVILYLSNTYHMPGLLERNLDSETYSGYVYENKAEDTKQMLIELYTIIDDREYMNYLQSNNLELLIGSKFTLGNRDYSQTQEFEKLTEDWKLYIQCLWKTD